MRSFQPQSKRRQGTERVRRRGVLVPLVAVALVVVLGAIALVLDRLWLEMARLEMQSATEAAALAAARELAHDDLLRLASDPDVRTTAARAAAARIALENRVVGQPLELNTSDHQDIQFGVVRSPGDGQPASFCETQDHPTTAVVTARRERSRNNPVAFFIQGVSCTNAGDVSVTCSASIRNDVVGMRPCAGATVPSLPLAILKEDPSGRCRETWKNQIELRKGQDRFGYDETQRSIHCAPDGIPEIVLTIPVKESPEKPANACFLPTAENEHAELPRTIRWGWSESDLHGCGGEVVCSTRPAHRPRCCSCNADIHEAIKQITGECRLAQLYSVPSAGSPSTTKSVACCGLIAGRVLNCTFSASSGLRIVFQPGVLETRMAVLSSERPEQERSGPNPYLYKLYLTH